ncbi:MAG: 2OG-Fe(II) oxygenase [Sphingomonadales bacterium]|nr:MAG: 2OG-Fe(II) oxygenase [Sphingomonadales bacterium]
MTKSNVIPDQDALKRVGASVRERLAANPAAYKIDCKDAEIFAIGDFLTPDECFRLRTMIDLVATPSTLHEADYSTGFRTSYSGNFDPREPFVKEITGRIDEVLGLNTRLGETIQGQRYMPGQEFKPHYDWFYTTENYWKAERKSGGQRSWTAMIFLNEVEEGGETHFVNACFKVTPKTGVLMLWNNANPDGSPAEGTLHAGTPVTKGSKYVITRWYRTRPWG